MFEPMKERYLNIHSSFCNSAFCEMNPKRFLFFANNQFYLITYHRCMEYGDEYAFKQGIVKSVVSKSREKESVRVERCCDKDYRRENNLVKNLGGVVNWVNYIYENAARKQFVIYSSTKYIDAIAAQAEIDENYKAALEYLKANDYNEYLEDELRDLYYANKLWIPHSVMYSTTEELLKQLNSEINGNDKKSNNSRTAKAHV